MSLDNKAKQLEHEAGEQFKLKVSGTHTRPICSSCPLLPSSAAPSSAALRFRSSVALSASPRVQVIELTNGGGNMLTDALSQLEEQKELVAELEEKLKIEQVSALCF